MAITKYFYTPTDPDKDGFRQYIMETHPASPRCEKCGVLMKLKGTERKKNDPRIIFDIDNTNGDIIKIRYNPKAYRCSVCGKVIPDPHAPPLTKEMGSEDFRTYLAEEALSHSQWSAKDAGAKYGVSAGYVSESIKRLLEKNRATVVSFIPCSKLYIVSADCYETPCFVVFGYADSISMWVLLDIIESGNEKLLLDLCAKVSMPKEICCPPNPWLVGIMKQKLPSALLKIPTERFKDYLDAYAEMVISHRTRCVAGVVRDAVEQIKDGLKKDNFANYQAMEDWWLSMADNAHPDLDPDTFEEPEFTLLYSEMLPYCLNGVYQFLIAPEKPPAAVRRIQSMITRFRKTRTPVDIVRARLLYQNELFRRTLKQNKQMIYRGGYSFVMVPQMPQIEEWENCYTMISTE